MASYKINQDKVKQLREQLPQACTWCGIKEGLTLDHIIPVSKGGAKYELANLQMLCGTCNNKKGNKMPHTIEREREHAAAWQEYQALQASQPRQQECLADLIRTKLSL